MSEFTCAICGTEDDAAFLTEERGRMVHPDCLAHEHLWRRIAEQRREIEELRALVDRLLGRPDPLAQALNEGDGTYRP